MKSLMKRLHKHKVKLKMRNLAMTFALLSLAACAGNQPIVTTPLAECSNLIPDRWSEGVEAASIPTNGPVEYGVALTPLMEAAIIAPWAAAFVEMDGQLDKANGRTVDTAEIVRDCENLINSARADQQ